MNAQSSQESHIYCIVLLILAWIKASCSPICLTVSFVRNQGQFQQIQNNTTYSELWSDQGSWFLWPVVFAVTLWTTVVWPDRRPLRNTGKTKIATVSKTQDFYLPLKVDRGCCCLLNSGEIEIRIQLININTDTTTNIWVNNKVLTCMIQKWQNNIFTSLLYALVFLEGLFLLFQIKNNCSQQLRGLAKGRLLSGWILQRAINVNKTDTEVRLVHPLLTLPISEVHDTTMVLGTVVDSRMREVIFMGRLGLFGSTPFFVGGRYPCSQNQTNMWLCFLATWKDLAHNNLGGLTGRLQGLLLTFTHRLGGKWSSWGQLVSDKQNLKARREMIPTVHWSAVTDACAEIRLQSKIS